MFGMVFGKAELTTRVYDYEINYQSAIYYDITLSDITNGDLDDNQTATLSLFKIEDLSITNNYGDIFYLILNYDWGGFNLAQLETVSGAIGQGPISSLSYVGGEYHRLMFQNGDISATLKLAITAEFPEEDTGYIEEGFDYCIDVGANLVASPCEQSVPILDTLPSEIADNLTGIIGQGVAATNMDGNWVGSLSGLGGGNGYWILSNANACFNYDCVEN